MTRLAEIGSRAVLVAGAQPIIAPGALAVRFGRFIAERFSPLTYGPLILALVSCGWIGTANASDAPLDLGPRVILVLTVVALACFRLRLTDELKDADADRLGRPDRPLPRGLVSARELELARVGCVLLEIALAAVLGISAMMAYLLALAFTMAAARDFFVPGLHRHLVAYALAHAPSVPLLVVFIWWAHPNARWEPLLGCLVTIAGGAAFAIEVARKTLAPTEERPHVETYSRVIGPAAAMLFAAVALAIGWLGAAAYTALVGARPILGAVGLATGAGVVLWAETAWATRHPRLWRQAAIVLALCLLGWPTVIELMKVVAP